MTDPLFEAVPMTIAYADPPYQPTITDSLAQAEGVSLSGRAASSVDASPPSACANEDRNTA